MIKIALMLQCLGYLLPTATDHVNISRLRPEADGQGNCADLYTCTTGPILGNLFWYANFANGSEVQFARNDGGNAELNPPYNDNTLQPWGVYDYYTEVRREIIDDNQFTNFRSTLSFDVLNVSLLNINRIWCGSSTVNSTRTVVTNLQIEMYIGEVNYQILMTTDSSGITYECTGNNVPLKLKVENCTLDAASNVLEWMFNGTTVFQYAYEISRLEVTSGSSSMFHTRDLTQYGDRINFTSILRVTPDLQCTFIQCGSNLHHSEVLIHDTYTNTDIDVLYTAHYSGMNVELTNVNLLWTEEVINCNLSIIYTVELEFRDLLIFSTSINSKDCVSYTCSINMYINKTHLQTYKTNNYNFSLYRGFEILGQGKRQVSSISLLASEKSLFENISTTNDCQSSIQCPSFSVDDCNIRHGYDSSYESIVNNTSLAPNTSHTWEIQSLRRNPIYVEVSAFKNNMTVLVLRYNFSAAFFTEVNEVPYLVVGYITLAISTTMIILGYIRCALITSKHSNCFLLVFITIFHSFTSGICALSIILWITYHTTYVQDLCSNRFHRIEVAISAMSLSILASVISVVTTGGFCILTVNKHISDQPNDQVQVNNEKETNEEEHDKVIMIDDLKFGRELKSRTDNRKCIDCDETIAIFMAVLCKGCCKNMCPSCGERYVAYIPRNRRIGPVCETCNEVYWIENERIADAKYLLRKSSPPNGDVDESNTVVCAVCHKNVETSNTCLSCLKKVCQADYEDVPPDPQAISILGLGVNIALHMKCCSLCREIFSRKYHIHKRKLKMETTL